MLNLTRACRATGYLIVSVVLATQADRVRADAWDAPAGYYSGATGSGATLKGQLTTIMSTGHIQRAYGDFRFSAVIHDADPNNPGNILLVYNRASVSATWDSGSTWNREHVWPQSRQPGSASNSSKGNLGDPHALRPANPSINSSRSNKPFGFDTTTGGFGSLGSYYFPGDADKGDIARSLFYSDTRWSSLGLSLIDGFPSGSQMSDLSSLIRWNYLDVPDEFERRRNHTIYSSAHNPSYYTNNRNAYIDRPEYVWSVYGGNDNDTQLYVGGSAAGDGSSSTTIDLGAVLVGGAAPGGTTNVTLNKIGNDGAYYEITTAGGATSDITGRYNAFDYGTQSATLAVGLAGSTASAGLQSGTVIIDNLDVSSNSPTGRGGDDGDDLITVQYSVLDHANASFMSAGDSNSASHDFGIVPYLDPTQTHAMSVHNLEAAAGFTAELDVTGAGGTGDTAQLGVTLGLPASVAAGGSLGFDATLDTSTLGNFSATYTIHSQDDADLAGAAAGDDLTLSLTGVVAIRGDANLDKMVDLVDLNLLALNYNTPGGWQQGDFTGDGIVDLLDLNQMAINYGFDGTVAPQAPSVPEPASWVLLAAGAVGLCRRSSRR